MGVPEPVQVPEQVPGRDDVQKLAHRGLRMVFYADRTKAPTMPGWTDRNDRPEDYRGGNVGIFTGVEIAPGRFLADVDFDQPDGLPLVKRILPPTQFGFGRASKKISHAFYTTSEPATTTVFKDLDGSVIVELRGCKADGGIGFQTMAPPSIHPSGEAIVLQSDGEIPHSDEIARRVSLYAAAYLLVKHITKRALAHAERMALAGTLLELRLTRDEAILVGETVAAATGNDVQDVRPTVDATLAKMASGRPVTGARALAAAIGDAGETVIARLREWLGDGGFVCNKDKPIADHHDNLMVALSRLGASLSFDVFAERALVTWNGSTGPLNDAVRNALWFEIEKRFRFRPSAGYFDTFLQHAAQQNRFHPVCDYLDRLVWDGTPRLDTWLSTVAGAAGNAYTSAVGALVLIAAVRRVRKPGVKFDEVLILESGQGLQKSSALRMLCPDESWFSDDLPLNVDAKQIIERTLGKWLIEASDMHGYSAASVEQLKAMLSRGVDGPVRLAYARMPTERPRHFIVIGTTNAVHYLRDATGNRRFWPVRVERFDLDRLREMREQLWAEAAHREKQGESIRLAPELYDVAGMQQERRRQADPWEATLDAAFPRDAKHRLTWDDIYCAVGIPVDRRDPRQHERLLKILQQLGFRSAVVNHDGKSQRGMGRDAEQPTLPDDGAAEA
jgi:hypothetical protein